MNNFREIKPGKPGRKTKLHGAILKKFKYCLSYGASIDQLMKGFCISRSTVYKYINKIIKEK